MATNAVTRTETGSFLGFCSGCKTTVKVEAKFTKHSCGSWVTACKPIKARMSAHECGAKCTSALGPSCDCECGGQRHGSDHR